MKIETFDNALVRFFHSDENKEFLSVKADMLCIEESCIKVFSRDYEGPIVVVYEYDWWFSEETTFADVTQ